MDKLNGALAENQISWKTNNIGNGGGKFDNRSFKTYTAGVQQSVYGNNQIYSFTLPERPSAIFDLKASGVDSNDNLVFSGYKDGDYNLRVAYIAARNDVQVQWTGWAGTSNLKSITIMVLYV